MGLLKKQEFAHKNREEAIAQGEKTYIGSPCLKCGHNLKRVDSYGCVHCMRVRNLKSMKTPTGSVWQKKSKLKLQYGLTLEQYVQMFEDQQGKCFICRAEETRGRYKKLYVDHDHKTKKVRKLLCHRCNAVLGYVEEKIEVLEKAIEYLKFYNNCKMI